MARNRSNTRSNARSSKEQESPQPEQPQVEEVTEVTADGEQMPVEATEEVVTEPVTAGEDATNGESKIEGEQVEQDEVKADGASAEGEEPKAEDAEKLVETTGDIAAKSADDESGEAEGEKPAEQPKPELPKVDTPDGYEILFKAVVRRESGAVVGAFRPIPQPIIIRCSHGTQTNATNRQDAYNKCTFPATWCGACAQEVQARKEAAQAANAPAETPETTTTTETPAEQPTTPAA